MGERFEAAHRARRHEPLTVGHLSRQVADVLADQGRQPLVVVEFGADDVVIKDRRRVARQVSRQDLGEGGGFDGLGQVVRAAGGETFRAVLRHGVGGQGDDGEVAAGESQRSGRAVAVEFGHLHVHQHHVERARERAIDGQFAVGDRLDVEAQPPEVVEEDSAVVRAVLGKKHPPREGPTPRRGPRRALDDWRARRLTGREPGEVRIGRRQGDCDGEATPSSQRAVDGDHAAHRLDQASGDAQAEARPAEPPHRRGVSLMEGPEELPDLVGGHPDPLILDLDEEPALPSAGRAVADPHHDPTAGLGELDCVADEVHDDLPEPRRVHDPHRRRAADRLDFQRDALLDGVDLQRGDHFQSDLPGRVVDPLQIEAARLDLREVKDVVDDLEQMRPVAADRLKGVVAFGLGELGVEEHVSIPEHGRHRRPDFVAHVREELSLDAGSGLRRFLGLGQLGGALLDPAFQFVLDAKAVALDLLAVGDAVHVGRHAVAGRIGADLQPTVRIGREDLEAGGLPVAGHLAVVLLDDRAEERGEDVPDDPAEHVRATFAELFLPLGVQIGVPPIAVERERGVGDVLEDLADLPVRLVERGGPLVDPLFQFVARAAEGLLGPLAGRDVLDLGDEVQGLVTRVAHQGGAQNDPDFVSALVNVAFLHLVRADFPREEPPQLAEVGGEVVGMGDRLEVDRQQFFLGIADDLAEGLIDLKPAALQRHQGHADRRVVEGAAEALLALQEAGLRPLARADVPERGVEERRPVDADPADRQLDREPRAVAAHAERFDPLADDRPAAGLEELSEAGVLVGFPLTGNDQAAERRADHPVAGHPEEPFGRRVEFGDGAQVVDGDQAVERGFKDAFQPRLGVVVDRLGALSRASVAEDRRHADRLARVVVVNQEGVDVTGDPRAGLNVLERPFRAAVALRQDVENRHADDLVPSAEADQGAARRVDVGNRAVEAGHRDEVAAVLNERGEFPQFRLVGPVSNLRHDRFGEVA